MFLADEPMSDVEAMLWVLSQPPEVRDAKAVGLGALRAEMYDRNLQVGWGWGEVGVVRWAGGQVETRKVEVGQVETRKVGCRRLRWAEAKVG